MCQRKKIHKCNAKIPAADADRQGQEDKYDWVSSFLNCISHIFKCIFKYHDGLIGRLSKTFLT
jgi:hypothetical protein